MNLTGGRVVARFYFGRDYEKVFSRACALSGAGIYW
jgi:hypothetical protein